MSLLTPVEFIRVPEAPVPEGGEVFNLHTADGALLRVASFPVASDVEQKGTFVLLNGRCEIIEKYFEVISDLQKRGYAVATMDWRGQGLSSRLLPESEKGHIKSFGTYLADLHLFIDRFVKEQFEGPFYGMSHSMGGVPLLEYLAEGTDFFTKAVLSAPMTRIFKSTGERTLIRTLAKLGSKFGLVKRSIPGVREDSMLFEGNKLTSDETRHKMFKKLLDAAPNAAVHAPTYGWLHAAHLAMEALDKPQALAGIQADVLIVAAGNDRVVDGTHAPDLAHHYEKIECVIVNDSEHEVLMEQNQYRDEFWSAFDKFMI